MLLSTEILGDTYYVTVTPMTSTYSYYYLTTDINKAINFNDDCMPLYKMRKTMWPRSYIYYDILAADTPSSTARYESNLLKWGGSQYITATQQGGVWWLTTTSNAAHALNFKGFERSEDRPIMFSQ